jgi:flagellar hook-basal body complex protein FliE
MPDPFEIAGIGPRPPAVGNDPRQLRQSSAVTGGDQQSFKEVLAEAVGEVQRLQSEADTTIQKVVSGEIKDVTGAMIEIEKADVAFQTMMTVRNKIVAAYEEIMRMQV